MRLFVLVVVLCPLSASAYDPSDPYGLRNMPVPCSAGRNIYPCLHERKLVRSAMDDPTKPSLLKDDQKSLFDKALRCPDGTLRRTYFVRGKKLGDPWEARNGCPGEDAVDLKQELQKEQKSTPEPVQKPRPSVSSSPMPRPAPAPIKQTAPEEASKGIFGFITLDRVLCLLLGFIVGGIAFIITLGAILMGTPRH